MIDPQPSGAAPAEPSVASRAVPVPYAPAYGTASLADLPGSLLASLGLPVEGTLALEPASRVCLFLVDGLGAELLAAHPEAAPFLTAHLRGTLTAGFPSSTPTSLATLGTGAPPGEHGMVGIQMAVPGEGRLFNCLRWTAPGLSIDPDVWQPTPTVYERMAAAGVEPVYVAPASFDGTGLTRAVYRGMRHRAAESPDERVEAVRQALRETTFVTVYFGDVDRAGHFSGWGGAEWLEQVAVADRMAERIAEALPPGAVLYVTADHGMINAADRVDVDLSQDLREGVLMLGGEPRARHVYTSPGAAGAVLETWREVLRGRAWVVTREEAVAAGWFGRGVRREWLGRIGDVVAVPYGECVIVASAGEPVETSMIGYHGSLTPAEQNVPLVEIRR
ncbi:alkaline phosphatase family protein [Microbispora rosea subsp. aerata]|nr:nucleotide pyrophosphatase/phosphodiesterase family protein [Microbispora rosea]GGO03618.1 alkaline phosphatase family protein [Microbispora rosea subsp. aerata]GIH54849.1 alkaline phosphatase family protein [Microbispora rosea subsp. aerata]GLJ83677.1 alkaline phosphatase family protein [Microbispora rosea subsp. aerata]